MTTTLSGLPTRPGEPIEVVDAAAVGGVLIIGSLPPTGRDLDLAVRCCDLGAVQTALVDAGFRVLQHRYVRFRGATAQVVELTVLEDWGLPEAELSMLLGRARPLPGMRRVMRPAPEHVLLLLAPLCARGGSLTPHRRARLQMAVREDPGAWRRAGEHAAAWHEEQALDLLGHVADGGRASWGARISALAQPRRARGTPWVLAMAGAVREVLPQPRRGVVIALSGVDGAGKSSQATALAASLEKLGEDPVIVWSRVRYDPLLASLGGAVKRVLSPFGLGASGTVTLADPILPGHDAPTVLCTEPPPNPVIDVLWAHVCAISDGYRHLRLCVPVILRGQVVICDRYTLDTHVHLVERFQRSTRPRAVRTAAWLDRRLSPRPLRSFWLDVAPDAAWSRKPDDVHLDWLREHSGLYRSLHVQHGAVRLDTGDTLENTATDIARSVVSALQHARSESVVSRCCGRLKTGFSRWLAW